MWSVFWFRDILQECQKKNLMEFVKLIGSSKSMLYLMFKWYWIDYNTDYSLKCSSKQIKPWVNSTTFWLETISNRLLEGHMSPLNSLKDNKISSEPTRPKKISRSSTMSQGLQLVLPPKKHYLHTKIHSPLWICQDKEPKVDDLAAYSDIIVRTTRKSREFIE